MDLKEVEDIVKNVLFKHASSRYETLEFIPTTSLVSIDVNELGYTQPIPYKRWRVVAVGFTVTTQGVSTEDPAVNWGLAAGDLGDADNDAIGIVKQDVTADKQFVSGDCWIKNPFNVMGDAETLSGEGTPTWTDGVSPLGTWYENIAALTCTRPNDHNLSIMPFAVIEVRDE